jgi:hypothetical protein
MLVWRGAVAAFQAGTIQVRNSFRVPEAEYLIRPASHDGWLAIPATDLAEVRTPRGYDLRTAPGLGDLHLQAADYEISLSDEDPGWQVTFDGDISHLDSDKLVTQIARQIQDFTRTATEWVQYT